MTGFFQSGRTRVRVVLHGLPTRLRHLPVEQVTPPAVVLTSGLAVGHPLPFEVNHSVIKTIARRCVGFAPSDLKDLVQRVSVWLARWAIRATNVGCCGRSVRHRSTAHPPRLGGARVPREASGTETFAVGRGGYPRRGRQRAPWNSRFQGVERGGLPGAAAHETAGNPGGRRAQGRVRAATRHRGDDLTRSAADRRSRCSPPAADRNVSQRHYGRRR